MNKKNILYAGLIGMLAYMLHIAFVWLVGPILGLHPSGLLYWLFKIESHSIGILLYLVERFTHNILRCVTSPCLYLNLLISFFLYPALAIILYLLYSKIGKNFKK